MKKYNLLLLTALTGFSVLFAGCEQEDKNKHHYDNKLFIAATSFTKDILFKPGDANVTAEIGVSLAHPEAQDIKATIEPAPELLPVYKAAYYDDQAVLLPKDHYAMEETTTIVHAGSIDSPKLPIEFLNTGQLDRNTTYVLPVTVRSVQGLGLLQSAKNYYYIFKGASLINVVCNISNNRAYPDFNNDPKFFYMQQNTLEILFKANSFPNTLNTLMGIEGAYLLRIGDAGIPSNQLQLATSGGNCSSAELQFDADKWYHVACVFNNGSVKIYINGVEKYSGSVGMSMVNLGARHTNEDDGSRCFWVGYSYSKDRFLDGVVSEARIWNRALTPEEIQAPNHFYTVEPDSEGLIAYWKFDEGTGTTIKDHSASGYPLTFDNDPKWEPVALP